MVRSVLSLAAALLCTTSLMAGDADLGAPNQEYLDQKAELEQMLASRNLETYELSFVPLALDRLALKDRLGNVKIYNYLTFRLRNEVADQQSKLLSQAKGYNEVLAAMTAQYEQARVAKANGVALTIDGIKGDDGVIVERKDAQTQTRAVHLDVLAFDEHGTRLRLLNEPIGSGPHESFNFRDLGDTNEHTVSQLVKDKVEEVVGRKLLSVDQISAIKLPPYNPTKRDEIGWAEGEVYGVVLFQRLSDYGHQFTFELHGLSNKFRIHWPEAAAGKPENYLDAQLLRRTYVLQYAHPGDEYFRDQDKFELTRQGWDWLPTFQRNEQRRAMAYTRYFLNNISDRDDRPVTQVEDEFWKYYADARTQHAGKTDKLPDLEATLKAPAP